MINVPFHTIACKLKNKNFGDRPTPPPLGCRGLIDQKDDIPDVVTGQKLGWSMRRESEKSKVGYLKIQEMACIFLSIQKDNMI